MAEVPAETVQTRGDNGDRYDSRTQAHQDSTAAQLDKHYRSVAGMLGCHYLNASEHAVSSDIDGVHLDARQQHALGTAVAEHVQPLLV